MRDAKGRFVKGHKVNRAWRDKIRKCQTGKYGEESHRWKNARTIDSNGYVQISRYGKVVLEHRYNMENYLGRHLDANEEVHHINGNKEDNRISNLMLLSKSNHTYLHWEIKRSKGENMEAQCFTAVRV